MELDTNAYMSDFAKRYVSQGRAKGRAKGRAEALLRVLGARGIAVTDDARERIDTCEELEALDRWIERAVTVASLDELFAE